MKTSSLFLFLHILFIHQATAFWRLPCNGPLVVQRADPIVTPNKVSGHVHTIMGGNGFGFNMDYNQARSSSCSSCSVKQDLSNYWVPALYYRAQNGSFAPVNQAGGGLIYYLQRKGPGENLLAFPPGFRMVAGNPFLRSYSGSREQEAVSWACLGISGHETPYIPNQNCPQGLRAQVFFPSCWDGKNLDSADHKSHMTYPSTYNAGSCPPSHPKRFISLFYEVIWQTNEFKDMWYGNTHPFVLANGDPTGFGHHGDFVNGWDVKTLQRAVDECTNDSGVVEDCHVFDFFTHDQTRSCKIPTQVDEPVEGWLSTLPGCNPLQHGPGQATPKNGCGSTTAISKPKQYFTDVIKSMGWQYIGCGTDDLKVRTFPKRTTSQTLTPASCIQTCAAEGYAFAGMEYSNECYCGNALSSTRAPKAGFLGDCTMSCAGDASQYCGGHKTLSIYKRCSNGGCVNVEFKFAGANPGTAHSLTIGTPQTQQIPSHVKQPIPKPAFFVPIKPSGLKKQSTSKPITHHQHRASQRVHKLGNNAQRASHRLTEKYISRQKHVPRLKHQ
jgi:hypothetical protein